MLSFSHSQLNLAPSSSEAQDFWPISITVSMVMGYGEIFLQIYLHPSALPRNSGYPSNSSHLWNFIAFQWRHTKGVRVCLWTIDGIKSFQYLLVHWNLPAGEVFRYATIKHYIFSLITHSTKCPTRLTPFNCCQKDPNSRGLVSALYSSLQTLQVLVNFPMYKSGKQTWKKLLS